HRLRQGVYIDRRRWEALDAVERHVVMAKAVSLRCADDAVFSHATAAVLLGLPVWNVPLGVVTVTRRKGFSGRFEADVRHVEAPLGADEIVEVDGLRVTSLERTMVDVAREYDLVAATVICDAALRAGADRDRAFLLLAKRYTWSRTRLISYPLRLADGRAESPGESRLRVLVALQGLPEPEPQGALHDRDGRFIGRGDLVFWTERTVVEFDGMFKYGVDLDERDPRDRLFQEKVREDRIREAGYEVVRVTWVDLDDPFRVAARIRAAFARAAERRRFGA